VDAKEGTTTFDRAKTIAAIIDPDSTESDFYSTCHVFSIIARPSGVLQRIWRVSPGGHVKSIAAF
jgi:3,4-dihydroxy 2-butanone 4-phosphate synthase/GTP cyclohydrolase II